MFFGFGFFCCKKKRRGPQPVCSLRKRYLRLSKTTNLFSDSVCLCLVWDRCSAEGGGGEQSHSKMCRGCLCGCSVCALEKDGCLNTFSYSLLCKRGGGREQSQGKMCIVLAFVCFVDCGFYFFSEHPQFAALQLAMLETGSHTH